MLNPRRPDQIVLSHFSRSTEDLGVLESFPHRQLRTTMDVRTASHFTSPFSNVFSLTLIALCPDCR